MPEVSRRTLWGLRSILRDIFVDTLWYSPDSSVFFDRSHSSGCGGVIDCDIHSFFNPIFSRCRIAVSKTRRPAGRFLANVSAWAPEAAMVDENNTIRLGRVICDFIVLLFVAAPLLIFHEWVVPYKRGFYCDDETIRYPYRPSTVTRQMLIVVGLLIPILLILATELFRAIAWERKYEGQFKTYHVRNHSVHRLLVRLYCFIGYFFVGVCFNQLMVDIAKYTIGRQRPHFMDVCRPSQGYLQCVNPDLYITDFNCTTSDLKLIHESQLSFYSGHAAFSFYGAWFTSLYLQARLFRPLFSRLLIPVIQFLLFGGAAYVALTRVSDYKHHWSDVLVGALMGSAIGIFVAFFVAEVFKRREIPSSVPVNDFGLIRQEKMRPLGPSVNDHTNGSNVVSTQSVIITNEVDPANQRLLWKQPSPLAYDRTELTEMQQRTALGPLTNNRPISFKSTAFDYGPIVSRVSTSFTDGISFYSALADWDATSAGALSGRTDYMSLRSDPSWMSASFDSQPARL
ncbi:unnamed protein product [Caenorhabditis auriculariae]|uniref:Phosphatidic acid phosphatase type 2/haloperoxidase domain-containing protein n=1 Tax=Caenorhabditis auriculariae TaxID=2777116 RepID=A0A8S1HHN0_9PELO|nr:unnamed protein product [Caenorhabditis auriculariae]